MPARVVTTSSRRPQAPRLSTITHAGEGHPRHEGRIRVEVASQITDAVLDACPTDRRGPLDISATQAEHRGSGGGTRGSKVKLAPGARARAPRRGRGPLSESLTGGRGNG